MAKYFIIVLGLWLSTQEGMAQGRCLAQAQTAAGQEDVESVAKAEIIAQIESGEMVLTDEEATEIRSLLRLSRTLAFQYEDAGTWLSLFEGKHCRLMKIAKIKD